MSLSRLAGAAVTLAVVVTVNACGALPTTKSSTPTSVPQKSLSTPTTDSGEVKGKMVDKATGQPAQVKPVLFAIYKGTESEEQKAKMKDHKPDLKADDTGAFSFSNVLEGQYQLMAMIPSYGYKSLGTPFEVSAGKVTDLGTIEVPKQ